MLWPAKIAKLETDLTTATGQLAAATALNLTLQERVTSLEASGADPGILAAERAKVITLTGEKVALTGQLEAAFASNEAFKASVGTEGLFTFGGDANKPVIALTDAGKTKLINADAARTLAASGHQPLNVAVDTPPGAAASAPKLKGRERLRAATRLEFSRKQPAAATV